MVSKRKKPSNYLCLTCKRNDRGTYKVKGYFNTTEQSQHLIMLSAMVIAKEMTDGNAISKKEKERLEDLLSLMDFEIDEQTD